MYRITSAVWPNIRCMLLIHMDKPSQHQPSASCRQLIPLTSSTVVLKKVHLHLFFPATKVETVTNLICVQVVSCFLVVYPSLCFLLHPMWLPECVRVCVCLWSRHTPPSLVPPWLLLIHHTWLSLHTCCQLAHQTNRPLHQGMAFITYVCHTLVQSDSFQMNLFLFTYGRIFDNYERVKYCFLMSKGRGRPDVVSLWVPICLY